MDDSRSTGIAALAVGACVLAFMPLLMVVWPAAGVDSGDFTDGATFLPFVRDHRVLFALPYVVGLVMHLIGIGLVVGSYRLFRGGSSWMAVGAAAGLLWMAFDLAYNGMVLHVGPQLATATGPGVSAAQGQWDLLSRSLSALQLTGHLGGGAWMLTTSLVAGRARSVPRPFAMFGAVAGPVLMVSFLGPEALYPSFLLVPAWMIWLGIVLLKRPAEGRQPVPATALRAATP